MPPTPTRARLLAALLVAAVCVPGLAGCTQWRFNLGSPLSKVDLPEPESGATLADALLLLGPPQRISAFDTGYVMAWEHWHVRENSLGFSLGMLGADFMSVDWGAMYAKGEFLLMTFDGGHRLTAVARSSWDNHHGGGQAVQPLFSFVDVVDSDDLTGRMPTHRWGASLLQRLPVSLNAGSSPDTGGGGIEQRGTPNDLGQRSLEMD